MASDIKNSSMEIVRLSPKWQGCLKQFCDDLKESGDDVFFSPHSTDDDSICRVANLNGKDIYCLLVEDGKALGYGMLRGWDEGYQIPSIGLAIHPSARGNGLGKLLMDFLHASAARRGAKVVRLRVFANNGKALKLYKMLGYSFKADEGDQNLLIGFKNIGND